MLGGPRLHGSSEVQLVAGFHPERYHDATPTRSQTCIAQAQLHLHWKHLLLRTPDTQWQCQQFHNSKLCTLKLHDEAWTSHPEHHGYGISCRPL
jgi:hypothetical protein